MKCRDFERRLCDYLDDALEFDERREMDDHALSCVGCADALSEADLGLSFLRQTPRVEPPAELIADIIHDTVGVGSGRLAPVGGGAAGGGLSGWLRPLFGPILEPRLVMSMAMTVLSFSMLTFYGQRAFEQYRATGESPTAAVTAFTQPVRGLWNGVGDAIGAAAAFYQLQTEPFRDQATGDAPSRPAPTPGTEPDEAQPEGVR